jgi:DNA polymerase I-like protein with 3'-5' exonuclease and polymerase domains
MNKICVVEKYPSNYNYEALLPFDFDRLSLVDEKMDKVLKRDITLDIDLVKEEYEFIILIGKEASKFVGNITSVMEYQGYLLDEKYLALMNPLAVALRPSLKASFDKAINDIIITLTAGEINLRDVDILPLEDEASILKYLNKLIEHNPKFITMDTETSALYPRDGYVLGISISHRENQGVYMDTMDITDAVVEKLQYICNKFKVVFHNAKFDIKMLFYHFGLNFPDWDDTMLLHFDLDENNPHKLKYLAIKYTDLGNYEADLEKFKTQYCRDHKIKKADFTYDLIPFHIMFPYAAKDTAATFSLYKKFMPIIADNSRLKYVYDELLVKGTKFLIDVEETGIPINKELIEFHIIRISDEIKTLTASLYEHKEVKEVEEIKKALFNVNSTYHLRLLFFDILDMPYTKLTETGQPSTDAEVLDELAEFHPIANTINKIKKLKKIKSTYLEKMLLGCDMDQVLIYILQLLVD